MVESPKFFRTWYPCFVVCVGDCRRDGIWALQRWCMWILFRVSGDNESEDRLSDNIQQVSRLAAVLCSIATDINFELQQQTEQSDRIVAKVSALDRLWTRLVFWVFRVCITSLKVPSTVKAYHHHYHQFYFRHFAHIHIKHIKAYSKTHKKTHKSCKYR